MKSRVKADEMKLYFDLNIDPVQTFKKMAPSDKERKKYL